MGNCTSCGTPSSESLCSSCCQSNESCCQEVIPACPTPYYAQPGICVEDHAKKVFYASYAAALKVANAFNMPSCGASAELNVPGLKAIAIGSYLWNQTVGYLQVIAFDLSTGKVTVQNNCQAGNAAPGTTIAGCTLFAVTDPPQTAGGGSPTGIFVAIDFTAPNVGTCLLITVTGVTGLAVNKNVGIGSGTYRINAIPDSTHIEICNDGLGITPGSAVIAKNGAGEYQYPLVAIDVNPCTNTKVDQGVLLVCKDGLQSPLGGTQAGMVPVLQDADTDEVKFVFLDVPTRTCATITCCLTIMAGLAGPYVIPVSDSSQFTVGDYLQIGTRTDRFIVSSIPDTTHIIGNFTPVPGASTDIDPGTSICLIDCCEDLQGQVNQINIDITNLENQVAAIPCAPLNMVLIDSAADPNSQKSDSTDVLVNAGNPAVNCPAGANASWTITNSSPCRNVLVFLVLQSKFVGDSAGGQVQLAFDQVYTVDANPPSAVIENRSFDENDVNDVVMNTFLTFVLAPLQVLNITLISGLAYLGGAGGYTVRDWENRIIGIGNT